MPKQQVSLSEYQRSPNKEELQIIIDNKAISSATEDVFRKLERLGLLTEKVIMSLIAQAPIDPAGMLAFCSSLGGFEFIADNFAARKVLSRDKTTNEPTSAMMVDVLSNDIIFLVSQGGEFVVHKMLTLADVEKRLEGKENREEALQGLLETEIMNTMEAIK